MPDQAIREQLDDLIRKSGQGYAEISRLLGRNPAYIQQYIRRGVPRRLGEMERRILAQHFSVPESLLGAPPDTVAPILILYFINIHHYFTDGVVWKISMDAAAQAAMA